MSPIVVIESIFITGAIEAHEGRKVNFYDIPGAYLHANCEDGDTYIKLEGHLAELMVLVDPKLYRKHVRYSSTGEALLYVCITKARYGILKSAPWWYKELRKKLENYGFEVNLYNPCVANADVNGSQMTATWYVDDLKVSHMELMELKKVGQYLRDNFGDVIMEHTGDVQD